MLAHADAIVVTADSANMLGEAASTGVPILVFTPTGLNPKFERFLDGLRRHGAVSNFGGRLETRAYEPLNSTPLIAREILRRFHGFLER
jgi:mitochondrial fission protein ELM1